MKTITIKTDIPNKIKEQYEKVMNELYYLEDLNEYKNNSIGKAVNILQAIKFKETQWHN